MTPPPSRRERVWDYPRPPRLEPTSRQIRVVFGGLAVADSSRALRLLETSHPPTYYVPPQDVRLDLLTPTARRSFCEWKGAARYFTLRVADAVAVDCAWAYPDPSPAYVALRDHLAFYAAPMQACYVGDELATPQPGGFYGGWVTSDLEGPFKGAPGTQGW